MTGAAASFAGNLTESPEVRYAEGGITRPMFRVAVSGGRGQEASIFTVSCGATRPSMTPGSLSRGSRVVVAGRPQQRVWTAEDGSAHSTVEVVARGRDQACGGRGR